MQALVLVYAPLIFASGFAAGRWLAWRKAQTYLDRLRAYTQKLEAESAELRKAHDPDQTTYYRPYMPPKR